MRLNHPVGVRAEEHAWRFLQAQGCRLVARNWHCAAGEIDLIVWHGQTLVFVEVKYRASGQFGGAAYSITAAKQAKLQRSALLYLQQHDRVAPACRFDAVLLEGDAAPIWLQNILDE